MTRHVEIGKYSMDPPPHDARERASTHDARGRASTDARGRGSTYGGLRIDRNGVWFHNGLPFRRPALVRLFSTVLKRGPDGGYLLETPVERVEIEVEDAPFVAVEMQAEGEGRQQQIRFRTNIDEWVPLGSGHPLRLAERPYLLVRPGIEAAVLRAPWYELAELAEEMDTGYVVWSGGEMFDLGALDDDA